MLQGGPVLKERMLQGAQGDKFRIIIPQLARQHFFIIYASFKMCLQWQIINTH